MRGKGDAMTHVLLGAILGLIVGYIIEHERNQ